MEAAVRVPRCLGPGPGPEPAWLAWHCCALVGTTGPRPLRGLGGGGAELAAAVGTDSSGRKTQAGWARLLGTGFPLPLPTLHPLGQVDVWSPLGQYPHQGERCQREGSRLQTVRTRDGEGRDPSSLSRNRDSRGWHQGHWLACLPAWVLVSPEAFLFLKAAFFHTFRGRSRRKGSHPAICVISVI